MPKKKNISVVVAIRYGFSSLASSPVFLIVGGLITTLTVLSSAALLLLIPLLALVGVSPDIVQRITDVGQTCLGAQCVTQASQIVLPAIKNPVFIAALAIAVILGNILAIGLRIGYAKMLLEFHDKGKSSFGRIFSGLRQGPKAFAAGVVLFVGLGTIALAVVGMAIGLIALLGKTFGFLLIGAGAAVVLWGFYVTLRCGFFLNCIADYDAGIIDSLRDSWRMTQGYTMTVVLLRIAQAVTLGFFSMIAGLFGGLLGMLSPIVRDVVIRALGFAIEPAVKLADIHVYRALAGKHQKS